MTSTYHPPSRSFAPSVTALAREQGHEVSSHGEPGPGRRWVGAEVETQVSKSAAFALACLHAEHIRPQCRMGLIARLWSRQFLENTRTGGKKDNEVENHAINRGARAGCVIARVRGGIARGSGVSDRLAPNSVPLGAVPGIVGTDDPIFEYLQRRQPDLGVIVGVGVGAVLQR